MKGGYRTKKGEEMLKCELIVISRPSDLAPF